MRCPYQCHEVGGPWIEENPNCPIHSRAAQDEIEQVRSTAEYWQAKHDAATEVIDILTEALQQIIDLPEDSRIHYKVARRALAKVQSQ